MAVNVLFESFSLSLNDIRPFNTGNIMFESFSVGLDVLRVEQSRILFDSFSLSQKDIDYQEARIIGKKK